ncbi:MAG: CheY-like chemotaxis protein [Cyclobacteriaceae bacterium]|jgi:CheY-like chemotaxis protein
MSNHKILWADDEIDLLKPHLLFLESRGYVMTPVNSGRDAIDQVLEHSFDLVFLDENMPGMSGLETLVEIKAQDPHIPVVMITKSEEEHIMEEAIGSKIADYLIKPINPNQILLSIKRILDNKRIITEKTNQSYRQQFADISMQLQDHLDFEEWVGIYKKLIYWDMQIENTEDKSMSEVLEMQKSDANHRFCDFISDQYQEWVSGDLKGGDRPILSHEVLPNYVLPKVAENENPTVLIVIDNLRYDQWEVLEPEINKWFNLAEKDFYYSILPTTTAYARNALFAGLTPLEIEKQYPDLWVKEDQEGSKNQFENELLGRLLQRNKFTEKYSYHKILHEKEGKALVEQINDLKHNKLTAVVFNFVDMLSHARTDMQIVKQLAPDEAAYRELTLTWFNHSSLQQLLKSLAELKFNVIITTDHGTVRVKKPEKIVGEKSTNTNLRYKQGKRLGFDAKKVIEFGDPREIGLPKSNLSSSYIFAKEDQFFVYPNNFNQYVNLYKDTFQHGGISMEEIILPLISLKPK